MSKGILSLSSDEEADVLASENKKGLANLFDKDRMSKTGQNASLHYTAPKQPKADKGKAGSKESTQNVMMALPIVAQQYVDGQYVNKERVSLALLGNPQTKEYTLMIYKTQTDRRLTLRVEATLNFNVKENNFVNFYDETRQAWALKFDSSKDLYEAASSIALAKANITGLRTLLLQNLQVGEGQEVATGDTVAVFYSGWVFSNGAIAKDKPFDSNVKSEKFFKFKLGEKSVIQGWEQGMVGMKRGGKKLIMIPSKLAYGEKGVKGRIPPNACLIFEVELVKVKFVTKEVDSRELPSLPSTGSEDDFGSTVQERVATHEEQLDGPESTNKSAIIDRLARVGQQILPQKSPHDSTHTPDLASSDPRSYHSGSSGRSTPVSTASSSAPNPNPQPHYEHPHPHPHHEHPHPPPDPYYPPHNQMPHLNPYAHPAHPYLAPHLSQVQQSSFLPPQPSTALAPLFNQVPFPGQAALLAAQAGIPAGPTLIQTQPAPAPAPQGVGVGEFSQLMADTRVELGKMSMRLEDIGKKVDTLSASGSNTALVPAQTEPPRGGLLDPGVLLHSINKIVDENSQLKREVVDRDSRMEGLNQRINQLLQANQRYVEQSQQLLEQRSDSMHTMASSQQSRLGAVEQEKNEMMVKFEEAKRHLDQKNLEVAEHQGEAEEVRRKYEHVMQKMAIAKEKFREKESEIEDLKTESEQARRTSEKLKSSHNKLRSEIEDLNTSLEDLREKTKQDRSAKIKLEARVTGFEDEVNELREENEQLQRAMEDRKRKSQQDKQKMQAEMEQLRSSHEEDIQSIKEHLHTTSSGASSVEVAKIESSWKRKLDQAIADAEANSYERIEELQSSEDKLRASVQRLEKKIQSSQTSDSKLTEQTEQILELQDQLRLAQEKLNRAQERELELREEASAYGEREGRLNERLHESEVEMSSLRSQVQEGRERVADPAASSEGEGVKRAELDAKIKLIMNQLYQVMRSQFEVSGTYDGSFVLTTIMQTIKQETIRQLRPPDSETDSEGGSEPESSEAGDQAAELGEDGHNSGEEQLIEKDPDPVPPPATHETLSASAPVLSSSPEENPSNSYAPVPDPDHMALPSNYSDSPTLNAVSDNPEFQESQGVPTQTPSAGDNSLTSSPPPSNFPVSSPPSNPLASSPPNPLASSPPSKPLGSSPPSFNPLGSSPQISSIPHRNAANPLSTSPSSGPSQEPPSDPLTTPGGDPLFGGDSYSVDEFFKPLSSDKREKAPASLPSNASNSKPSKPAAKGSALFSDDDDDSDEFGWLK